ncbi:UNVERIFIED_CONTAM: hypothetical protein FKN15_010945 [Acipenser sinensis]
MECKDEASDTDSGIILQSGLDSPTHPVKDMPTHTRAVKLRQQSLEDKLESCRLELRKLCIREAELTGILSKEFPLKPGEKAPNVRRRIGAAFKLDELSILQQGSDPKLSSLEAELALQFQIYEAARRLSLEENISRHMKRNRLNQCEKEQKKLKELQQAVNELHTKAGHKPLHPGSQLRDPDPHGSDDSSLSDAALLEDEGVPALTLHPVCETSSSAAPPPHSSPLPPTRSHRPLPPQTLEGLILGHNPSLEYDRSPIQNTAWRESSLDQPYEKPKKTNSAASSQSSSPAGTPVSTPVDFRLGDAQLPYQFSPIMKLPLRHTHSSSAPSTPEMQGRWVHSQSVRLPSSDPSHDPLESRGRSRLPRRQSANFMMSSQDHPFPQPRMNLSNPLYHSGSEDSNSDYSTLSYTNSPCQERMPELVRPGLPPYPRPPQNNCHPEFPLKPGEKAPNVRRRIGAAFKLDELSILQQGSDPKLSSLEAELALQFQIYEAARRLSLEENISRHMKRNRLNQCEKEQKKLKELQQAVNELHTKAGHKPLHPGSQLRDPDPHGSDDSSLSDAALLEDEGVPALTPHPVCETSSSAAPPPHSSPLPLNRSHRPLPPQTLEGLILGHNPSLEYDRSPIQNTAWRESSLDQPYEKPKKTNSAASSQSSSPAGTPVSTPVDFRLGDVQLPYQFSPIMKLPLRHTHSSSAPSTPEMQGRWVHSQSVRLPSSDPSHDPLESRGRSRLPRRQSANFMMTSLDHPFPQPRMNLSNPLYHSGSEDSNSDYSTLSYTSSPCQERMPELVRPGLPPYPRPPQNNCHPGFYKNPQNHSSPNFYPPHRYTEGGRGYLRESDLGRGYLIESDQGRGTRVWTEPCLLQAAQQEYDGVIEEFLAVAEKLFGPYVWGRYDVLFMPPSFPFGGMENPCLTFVTPCLLAGDRSLADVIVHEICHSWFGNLVTNANWGDFWLNEGFTMYAQRRVCTQIYGAAYASLEAATGRSLLRQHMDTTGEEHPLNKLRVQIKPGVDPDDTYNETPYEKGFCFVSYLAHLCGEQSRFDAFLRGYVDKFKFRSILAEDALEFYLEYFPDLKEKGVHEIAGLQFESWLNTPGWPPYLPDLSPGVTLMKPAEQLAQLWAAETLDLPAIKAVDTSSWKTYQTVYFLDKILENSPLPTGNVQQLEELYPNVSKARNAELRLRWAQIVLKNHHEPQFHQVRSFLHSQGKQKYTLPLYRAMWSGTEQTKALAMEIFSSTAKQLHSNVRSYVKRILS